VKNSTFLLLHGAWHDSTCWRLVIPLLQAQGHTVITPDLPGHGASSLPPARATLKAYTRSIVDLLQQLDSPVTLVGHSMAGMVITEVAAKLPHKLARLVYLCAYLPKPGDSVFALIARNRGHEPLAPIELAMEMSADKRTCSVNADDIVPLFYSDTATALAQTAQQRFAVQGSLPLAATVQYDIHTLAAVPRTYLCCLRDKVIPLHHQRRMLASEEAVNVVELNSDHSPFYSCPEQLARALISL
jgi:pimeloyl-ACP methyl ester carboxylesterase